MESKEYLNFLNKFKTKKTTDDCYTPPNIYNAVLDWVVKEYGIDREKVLRPFYPGGDYENADYPKGYTVVDNPPFSITSKIIRFYEECEIPFFLFVPGLSALRYCKKSSVCVILTDSRILYENGAEVPTSFCTNLDENLARSAPDLSRIVTRTNSENRKKQRKQLPKYEYPDEVFSAAIGGYMAKHGVEFKIKREEATYINALDEQRRVGKAIYGGGVLLSRNAAARNAAARNAAARNAAFRKWELSERERKIVEDL